MFDVNKVIPDFGDGDIIGQISHLFEKSEKLINSEADWSI